MSKLIGIVFVLAIAGTSLGQKPPPLEQPWVHTPKNSSPVMTFRFNPALSFIIDEGDDVEFEVVCGDKDTFQGERTLPDGTVQFRDDVFRTHDWGWEWRGLDQSVFEIYVVSEAPFETPDGDDISRWRLVAKPRTSDTLEIIYADATDTPGDQRLKDSDRSISLSILIHDKP